MILNSFGNGFRTALRNKGLILLYYVLNLVSAALVAVPLGYALSGFAGNSLLARNLVSRLDTDIIFELIRNDSGVVTMSFVLALGSFCVYWFINLFFSAGAVAVFHGAGENRREVFWKNTSLFAGPFFRLFLWSIPVFIICFALQFLVPLFIRIFFGSDPVSGISFWSNWIRVFTGFLGLLLYESILDYSKIDVVIRNNRKTRSSLAHGLKLVFRHPLRTIGLSLSLFILSLFILALYKMAAPLFIPAIGFSLLCAILLQQVYIILRTTLKLTLIAAEIRLRDALITRTLPPVQPTITEWFEHRA